ncbi:MAG TPA: DoxX family protein, partial [Nitrospira sp.]|nr:DoxX family protein [Nitrospira sp.]
GLIAGFLTRFTAAGFIAIMMGAIVAVHWPHGFFMNWFGQQQGEGFEYHLLVIAMSAALVIIGGGKWALDGVIARWGQEHEMTSQHPMRKVAQGLRLF